MKLSIWITVPVVLVAAGTGFVLGGFYGKAVGCQEARNQLYIDIEAAAEGENVQMQELLKARYYYYSNRAKVRLRRGEGDFGPVNESLVSGFSPGKGLTTFKEEYEAYKKLLPE